MGNFSLDNFHYEKQDKTLHSFSTILTTKTVVAWSIVARGSRNSYTNEAAHCAFDLTDWETVSWKYVRLWHSEIHSISHSSQVPSIQKHCSIVCRVRKCDKREWNEIHCVVLMSKNRTNRDGNNNNYVSVKRHHCMPISWTKSFKQLSRTRNEQHSASVNEMSRACDKRKVLQKWEKNELMRVRVHNCNLYLRALLEPNRRDYERYLRWKSRCGRIIRSLALKKTPLIVERAINTQRRAGCDGV